MYIRLSREDGDKQESESIGNQRKILQRYVKENNLCLVKEYVDDGISGTTFDRHSFNELLQDIENKTIDMVITKDLSRLGRNYIETGKYTEEYFPEHNIRFIAIFLIYLYFKTLRLFEILHYLFMPLNRILLQYFKNL